MSTTPSPLPHESRPAGAPLRNLFVETLLALALLVPKLLHLRRNPRSWLLFRILLALAGAALVILPLGLENSYVLALVGMGMFTAAILLPPARPQTSPDDKARELGAFVVVNGGRFRPASGSSTAVQLFVCAERILVLDDHFESLLAIPVNEITLAHAEESRGQWLFSVHWADRRAEFIYRGIFAEHLARVAESAIRSVTHPAVPVIPQRRAAGA